MALHARVSHADAGQAGRRRGIRSACWHRQGAVWRALRGVFNADANGEYRFTLSTETGGMLFVRDIGVVEEPYRNPAGTFSSSVRLLAGWHPVRV